MIINIQVRLKFKSIIVLINNSISLLLAISLPIFIFLHLLRPTRLSLLVRRTLKILQRILLKHPLLDSPSRYPLNLKDITLPFLQILLDDFFILYQVYEVPRFQFRKREFLEFGKILSYKIKVPHLEVSRLEDFLFYIFQNKLIILSQLIYLIKRKHYTQIKIKGQVKKIGSNFQNW